MRTIRRTLGLPLAIGFFVGGFVCGGVAQRSADAQVGEMGGKAMEKLGESGGALGSAARLGTSITDMQEHVTGLQKNLETLKQIQAALGG